MEEAFVDFYKNLFTSSKQKQIVLKALVNKGKHLTEDHLRILQTEFTKDDVKRVMFSIPDYKPPGNDGFNNCFYKHCWEVIEHDVCEAVLDIFKTGKLLLM